MVVKKWHFSLACLAFLLFIMFSRDAEGPEQGAAGGLFLVILIIPALIATVFFYLYGDKK